MTNPVALRTERVDGAVMAQWDIFVGQAGAAGFMQSWAWGEFKRSCGQAVVRLGVFDGANNFCGAAAVYYVPSSLGTSTLEIPHGPVFCADPPVAALASEALMEELRRLAGELHSPAIRIEPFSAALPPGMRDGFVRAPMDLVPTPTLLVPLDRTEAEIMSAMEPKGRYNIRLAARKGVEVDSHPSGEALRDFYSLFELTSLRHGFSGETVAFFENMLRCLGAQGMVRIYRARFQGMLAAAAVVMFFGQRATYLYGGSAPFLGSVMAPYALHWRIMQDARRAGCREYDFYGIAPEGMPFHPYARFSQFKSRFGGRVFSPVGAHDYYIYSQIADRWVDNLLAIG